MKKIFFLMQLIWLAFLFLLTIIGCFLLELIMLFFMMGDKSD